MLRKLKNYAHLLFAVTANVIHFFPSRGITVIGVTGTDGKTTTSNLIYHILKESGKKVAVISTVGATIDGNNYETGFHVTTPSPFSVQKYVKLAKKKGCTHLVLEVTSHALDQNRVWGIDFEVGVLTNITHEHLDYHRSYKKYVEAKLRLFKKVKHAVINSSGEWFDQALKAISPKKIISYSLHGNYETDLTLLNVPFKIKTKLIGDFNLENILASIATAQLLGVEDEIISDAIQSFLPPEGRQQFFEKNGMVVMVDFAHTANSFERILPEIRKRTTGRVIHVFGCAGERDRGKRAEMGKAASFYDDIIILTAEDPRSEGIATINSQIKNGISGFTKLSQEGEVNGKSLFEIDDRKRAIEHAIGMGKANDTIIITGKGHEKSINYGQGEEKWSDAEQVQNYLKNL